ncbi:MAG: XRE family transcriptional regulator [Clostridia bacterium]|nr:XRE family transcriptional regulator [Clostridia bacterium]
MKFGEKLADARKTARLTQEELAKILGLSKRTIINYEVKGLYPRNRDIYYKIAEVLRVEPNYLLTEDEEFIMTAGDQYGPGGAKGAQQLLEQTAALFAGGELSEDDKLAFLTEIQQLYLDSKARAKKFAPNKHKR